MTGMLEKSLCFGACQMQCARQLLDQVETHSLAMIMVPPPHAHLFVQYMTADVDPDLTLTPGMFA